MALGSKEASIGIGLATGAVAFQVYNMSLPPVTDVRAAEPENQDVSASERTATWISAGIVTGVALLTGDATVFIIGGTVVIALSWLYRHADQVSPLSGMASLPVVGGGMSEAPADPGEIYLEAGSFAG
jgi:hypothetical protein